MLPKNPTTCLLEFDETTRNRFVKMAEALRLEPEKMVAVVLLLGLERLEDEVGFHGGRTLEESEQKEGDLVQRDSSWWEAENRRRAKERREAKRLTARQEQVLRWLGEGWSVERMAGELGVKEVTVRTHLYRLRSYFRGVGLEELKSMRAVDERGESNGD